MHGCSRDGDGDERHLGWGAVGLGNKTDDWDLVGVLGHHPGLWGSYGGHGPHWLPSSRVHQNDGQCAGNGGVGAGRWLRAGVFRALRWIALVALCLLVVALERLSVLLLHITDLKANMLRLACMHVRSGAEGRMNQFEGGGGVCGSFS